MIEGINASLASTQVSRAQTVPVSTNKSFSAPPAKVTETSLSVNYISPHVKIDSGAAIRAITQFRDNMNGEVIRQYPTESQLQAYARSQEFTSAQRANDVARALQAAQDAQARVQAVKQPVSEPVESQPILESAQAAPVEAPVSTESSQPVSTGSASTGIDTSVTEQTTTES